MVKVIGEMDHWMSNAEILTWAKNKRKQHAEEDAEDREQGLTPTPRPQNFLDSLTKHERYLKSDHFPYEKNPSAYEGTNQDKVVHTFSEATLQKIQVPLIETYKKAIRAKVMTAKQAMEEVEPLEDKKELTDMELLMVHNHAPTCLEMLQPMIEDIEHRFTMEEQNGLVEVINEVFRADEMRAKKESMEFKKVKEAISDVEALASRAEKMTAGAVVDYTEPLAVRPKDAVGPEQSGSNDVPLGRPSRLE